MQQNYTGYYLQSNPLFPFQTILTGRHRRCFVVFKGKCPANFKGVKTMLKRSSLMKYIWLWPWKVQEKRTFVRPVGQFLSVKKNKHNYKHMKGNVMGINLFTVEGTYLSSKGWNNRWHEWHLEAHVSGLLTHMPEHAFTELGLVGAWWVLGAASSCPY